MSQSVGVVIPALNEEKNLSICLPALLASTVPLKVILVDSGSTDNTGHIAEDMGIDVLRIEGHQFNHGATREMARQRLNTDVAVMLTADAYITEPTTIEKLLRPILEGKAIAAYARQIPHDGAGIFEAFPREFNYGDKPQLRGIEDVAAYGVYTFFCSDSCAAYRNQALDQVGGFKPTLPSEDYFAVAKLLLAGHKVAYVPDAVIRHSHRYNLVEEFQRYFDTGYVRAEQPWVQELVGAAESRGQAFFLELIKRLARSSPHLIPYAMLQTIVKWLGYRVGYHGHKLPETMKRALSAQNYYWSSIYNLSPEACESLAE